MPIHECQLPEGGKGCQWGQHGTCYANRTDAEKQAGAAYSNGYAGDSIKLAVDRSMRHYDDVGRLHVAVSNISKAQVSPYHATEIPGSKELGLDQDRVYMLLRDPAELEKAAPTSDNIQLLYRHIGVSAAAPQKDDIVGSTGTDAEFVAPYLRNSLVVWDAVAIAGIESRDQCELSCGYAYDPDMTPGTYEGTPYDGVMRNIRFNHVALVETGRAGPDVLVGDSNPFIQHEVTTMSKASGKTIAVRAALKAHLRPLLAQDCKIDINHIVGDIRGATLAMDAIRISRAIASKAVYAADAKARDEDVEELVKQAAEDESEEEAHKDDVEGGEKANKKLDKEDPQREGESDEDYEKRKKKAADKKAKDEAEEKAEKDEEEGGRKANEKLDEERREAHDSALVQSTIDRVNAIYEAKEDVAPLVGKLGAMDSAESVYRFALDHLGVDYKGVHPSAYRALVKAHTSVQAKPKLAQDSAGASDFLAQFPGAARLKRI